MTNKPKAPLDVIEYALQYAGQALDNQAPKARAKDNLRKALSAVTKIRQGVPDDLESIINNGYGAKTTLWDCARHLLHITGGNQDE